MYYGIQEYGKVYDEIIRTASSPSSCHLCIFVSCLNIDALCATKMLSILFKKQLVQSQIVPIFGYSELKWHYDQIKNNPTMNSIILVGFGGFIDIESFLNIDSQEFIIPQEEEEEEDNKNDDNRIKYSRNFYILDAHRPWNLDNLFGSNMIKCLDDGSVEEDSLTTVKSAYQQLLQLEEANNDDNEEAETDDTDEDGDVTDDDDEENVFINVNNKRINSDKTAPKDLTALSRKQRRKQIHQYETILEDYYAKGTTVVNSISSQVYSLLSSIGETNLSQLWLTILGTTSLDTEYTAIYQRLFPILQDEVARLTPVDPNQSNIGKTSSLKTADTLALEVQPDYYLFLLRYSSLYDSFYYSNYVNAKLSLWNENGKKRLHKMFARMGVPLNVAKESWMYMDNNIKRELPTILERNLDKYGLQDIIRDGFVKTFGYRGMISASEFVEALTALLEVGQTMSMDDASSNENNNETSEGENGSAQQKQREGGTVQVNSDTDNDDDNHNEEQEDKLVRKKWISNFWLSWDALDNNNIDILKHGIEHAKYLQHCIFDTGVIVLEKKLIKHLRIYRLCVLQDGPDLGLYANPLTLLRLGNWLIECCSETEEKQLLPFVLASLNTHTDTYLVAGLSPRYPRGLDIATVKRPILNNFSMAFQQITEQTGAQVRIDNFESSIIEVQREDLSPFLERLTLSGLI